MFQARQITHWHPGYPKSIYWRSLHPLRDPSNGPRIPETFPARQNIRLYSPKAIARRYRRALHPLLPETLQAHQNIRASRPKSIASRYQRALRVQLLRDQLNAPRPNSINSRYRGVLHPLRDPSNAPRVLQTFQAPQNIPIGSPKSSYRKALHPLRGPLNAARGPETFQAPQNIRVGRPLSIASRLATSAKVAFFYKCINVASVDTCTHDDSLEHAV